jgi:hypothetical protein
MSDAGDLSEVWSLGVLDCGWPAGWNVSCENLPSTVLSRPTGSPTENRTASRKDKKTNRKGEGRTIDIPRTWNMANGNIQNPNFVTN